MRGALVPSALLLSFTFIFAPPPAAVAAPEEGLRPINGTRLFCRSEGEGPGLVVVHGGPGLGHDYLYPHFRQLAASRRLVFYDQRGAGRSDALDGGTATMEQHVEDLEGVRQAYGLDAIDLAGQSWGALIALNYALKYPARVRRLLLLEPAPGSNAYLGPVTATIAERLGPAGREELAGLAQSEAMAQRDPATFVRFLTLRLATYFHDRSLASRLDYGYFDRARVAKFFDSSAAAGPYFGSFDLHPRLGAVACPVLIIHGESDPVPAEAMTRLRDALPHATLEIVKECGHFVHLEKPGEYFPRILAFLGEPAPAPGDPYLAQVPPGAAPVLFAPGLVSTGLFERDVAMSPDGREIYWTVTGPGRGFVTTLVSRLASGRWTAPEVLAPMRDPGVMHIEPAISPDGRQFFFTRAERGAGGGIEKAAIWVMDREGDGWGAPRDLGAPINVPSSRQFFPSVTRDGTLYFTRESGGAQDGIYRSRLANGRYEEPERLPAQVNAGTARYNAFVDPAERYVIVPVEGGTENRGGVDYYVVFRRPDGTWSAPVNLGDAVNTPGSAGYSPYISPDGRCFFFMSSRVPAAARPAALTGAFFRELAGRPQNGNADIYWMDAAFIERLRPAAR